MIPDLPTDMTTIKGFLAEAEAQALYSQALAASRNGPVLEVGSYCGKSTIYLGLACRQQGATLFALDHHRGSEEHQRGEVFHDPELYDSADGQFDSFGEFRRNIGRAGLNDTVVPLVSDSATTARQWQTPLAMVFIDGGHSLDAALTDYRCWSTQLLPGGILAIHDVFDDVEAGGQAPRAIATLALASGLFEQIERVETLIVLRRF